MPKMDLLTYAWRYVLARVWLFAGFSGLALASSVASFFVGQVLLHSFGFHTNSHLMRAADFLAGGVVDVAAYSLIVAPIFAGIYGIVFRMFDGDPEPVKGFSVLQQKYGQVAMVAALSALPPLFLRFVIWLTWSGFPGSGVSRAIELIWAALVFLALPTLIRFNCTPLQAFTYSIRRFAEKPLAFLGFYLGVLVLAISGALACGVGVLFTMGVLLVAPALLVYEPKKAE